MLTHGQSLCVRVCIVKVPPIGIINRRDEECERYKGAKDSSKVLGMSFKYWGCGPRWGIREWTQEFHFGHAEFEMPVGHLKNGSSRLCVSEFR